MSSDSSLVEATPVPPTGPDPGVTIWTYWGGGVGSANIYQNNIAYCDLSLPHCSTSAGSVSGIALSGNSVANPQYVNPVDHDYSVAAGSPAATWGFWDGN